MDFKHSNNRSIMAEIIDLLQKLDYYGAGKFTEIAKGKHELTTNFSIFKRKIKRLWRLKK